MDDTDTADEIQVCGSFYRCSALVFGSCAIAEIAYIVFIVVSWQQYVFQNASDLYVGKNDLGDRSLYLPLPAVPLISKNAALLAVVTAAVFAIVLILWTGALFSVVSLRLGTRHTPWGRCASRVQCFLLDVTDSAKACYAFA